MVQKKLTNNLLLFLFFVIIYYIGNNILYLPSATYADLPDETSKIENCKNEKIVKEAISNDNTYFNQLITTDNQKFHHIKKFNSNGVLIDSFGVKGTGKGEFLHPHGIGSDSKGNIYVSDAVLCNIQKFDSNGKFLLEFGKPGDGEGELYSQKVLQLTKIITCL